MTCHRRVSITTMRRWGMSWRFILLCVVGLHDHYRPFEGNRCARCGATLW